MSTDTETKPTDEVQMTDGPHCDHENEPGHVHGPECGHEEPKEKINQFVLITDVGPCRKHIKVTVDRGDIDKKFEEKFKELVGESVIPGFRPGKAPRKIVIRKFRKDVHDQVKSQILFASLEQLAEDYDIAPLSPPTLLALQR